MVLVTLVLVNQHFRYATCYATYALHYCNHYFSGLIVPSIIKEVDNKKIGIVGYVTPETTGYIDKYIDGWIDR